MTILLSSRPSRKEFCGCQMLRPPIQGMQTKCRRGFRSGCRQHGAICRKKVLDLTILPFCQPAREPGMGFRTVSAAEFRPAEMTQMVTVAWVTA
jgi:hypothetical protein